ncbi:MAG: hypothetical protein AABX33_00455 [Nanoarchaeota archaeon]|mgnify:CR=1 FL=1
MHKAHGLMEADLEFLRGYVHGPLESITSLKLEDENIAGKVRFLLRRKEVFDDLVRPPVDKAYLEEKKLRVVRVSPYLYSLAVVQEAFPKAGIEDDDMIMYAADMLSRFSCQEKEYRFLPRRERDLGTLGDMVNLVQEKCGKDGTKEDAFRAYVHLGELALFLAGVFAEHVRHSGKLRPMPADAYEKIGSTCYFRAHVLSKEVEPIFIRMSFEEEFIQTAQALNFATRKYIGIDPFVQSLRREMGSRMWH